MIEVRDLRALAAIPTATVNDDDTGRGFFIGPGRGIEIECELAEKFPCFRMDRRRPAAEKLSDRKRRAGEFHAAELLFEFLRQRGREQPRLGARFQQQSDGDRANQNRGRRERRRISAELPRERGEGEGRERDPVAVFASEHGQFPRRPIG